MWLKLNVSQKGLVLVSVPMVFELLLIVLLTVLLKQSEGEAARYAESDKVLSYVNSLTDTYLNLENEFFSGKKTRFHGLSHQFDRAAYEERDCYGHLSELADTSVERKQNVAQLRQSGEHFLSTLKIAEQTADPHPDKDGVATAFGDYMKVARSFAKQEERLQETSPSLQKDLRTKLRRVLLAGLVLNVALTFWLLKFFTDSITRRLAILTDNSRRLAKRDPLLPSIAGNDEIAMLDEHFHKMVQHLEEAENARTEYRQMINHDLRTPLASIQGTLAVTARGTYGELNPKGQQRILDAEQESERLISMISEMLDIEKLQDRNPILKLTDENLGTIIDEAARSVQSLLDAKQMTTKNLVKGVVLKVDRDRMLRVFINLFGNAIKFSQFGSSIEVSALERPSQLEVKIKDFGQGIPESALPHVFDRFWHTEASQPEEKTGHGLGLAICKAIVEAHQGTIAVDSKVGEGTTFSINLPM